MREKVINLDVRDDIRRGREPFSKIMQTVAQLRENESLRLTAPFEPKPLFVVLAKQGFLHESRPLESGDWEVLFSRSAARANSAEVSVRELKVVEVDARGLEPPQPMVKILEAVANLSEGTELRAFTDRRPMHLYAHLEQRGFRGQSDEQPDGSFITHIRRC